MPFTLPRIGVPCYRHVRERQGRTTSNSKAHFRVDVRSKLILESEQCNLNRVARLYRSRTKGGIRKILTIEWRGSARRRCCRAAVSGKRILLRRKKEKKELGMAQADGSSIRTLSAYAVIVHNARDECGKRWVLGAGQSI